MASNALLDMMRIKDLRDRIFFTLAILIVYRIGCVIPVPGISISALKIYFQNQLSNSGGQIEMFLDFFSGGAFTNFSIFMLGIMPYISMSIIMQLVMIVFPQMKKLAEEDGGKKKIKQYTRYGTIVVSIIQAVTVVVYARNIPNAITIDQTV